MISYRQPLTQWTLGELDLSPEARIANSYYEVVDLAIPEKETRCEFITGDSLDERLNAFAERIVAVTSSI
jgi:hypothetical protein